jgi:hypothetical protein
MANETWHLLSAEVGDSKENGKNPTLRYFAEAIKNVNPNSSISLVWKK